MADHRHSLYFTGQSTVSIRKEVLPRPAAGEVLVRSVCSAISAGSEMLVYRGQIPDNMPLDSTIPGLAGKPEYPLKYGYALSGVVDALGRGTDSGWLGKRVFAFHPHESAFVADTGSLICIPADIPDRRAVMLPNMETAINLLQDGRPLLGERVMVIGQGIVGLLTAALLRHMPLERLIVVEPLAERRRHAEKLGVDHCIDPRDDRQVAEMDSMFAGGPDLIYELSGSPEGLNQALRFGGFSSRIVIGSWYGRKSAPLNLGGNFHRDRITIISSQVSTLNPALCGRWDKARRLAVAQDWLRRIDIEAWITRRFPLHQAAEAYDLLDRRPRDVLQVVLMYGQEEE